MLDNIIDRSTHHVNLYLYLSKYYHVLFIPVEPDNLKFYYVVTLSQGIVFKYYHPSITLPVAVASFANDLACVLESMMLCVLS